MSGSSCALDRIWKRQVTGPGTGCCVRRSRTITPTKEIDVRRPSWFSKLGTGQNVEEGEKWSASPRVAAGLLAGFLVD